MNKIIDAYFRTFKTRLGAFTTAIIVLALLSYLTYKLKSVFGKSMCLIIAK